MKHLFVIIAAFVVMSCNVNGQEGLDFKSLKKKYSWTVPDESFKTDTVVIKGKIENFNTETSPFKTLQCSLYDEFEKQTASAVVINSDGSFEKKIKISYPVCNKLYAHTDEGFLFIPFFAYPGDTVEISAKIVGGKIECSYPSGRSKQFARFLNYTAVSLQYQCVEKARNYKDGFDKFQNFAENFWNEFSTKIYNDGLKLSFSDEEMSMALSFAQGYFAYTVLTALMYMREECYEMKPKGQNMYMTLKDTALYQKMKDPENYAFLTHTDFSDKNLFFMADLFTLLNRISYSLMPYSEKYDFFSCFSPDNQVENNIKFFHRADSLLRTALHTEDNSLVAQMVMYQHISSLIEMAWNDMTNDSIKEIRDKILPLFSFEPIKTKAAQIIEHRLNDTEIAVPIKKCAATAFIDSLRNVYKGKYLYLDFWSMGCAPCRMTIETSKDLRKEIANNPDIKLVFVNGDNPQNAAMREYVATHLVGEVKVVPGEDVFTELRDVFNFSGIPHFEVITPDGKVVKERYITFGLLNSFDYRNDQ